MLKPYQTIPIHDCGEDLVVIPTSNFAFVTPHPYQKLGAPYGAISPYWVRESVLAALQDAQKQLQQEYQGWQIQIFDAYRPLAVQQFMVDYTFEALRQQASELSDCEIAQQVEQFWAQPSPNPETPPPHSTGAAVDITLVNESGETLDLGGEIDEISARSDPNFYQDSTTVSGKLYHQRRELLSRIMMTVGFRQHPEEWWHFSLGDQMWAWLKRQESCQTEVIAYYGRIDVNQTT
ncbi:D-Ala-D-Ala dipeptidase [Halothece sp. PCC 7418]|uniref:M15 family metallopeptidase n=1 Tax=Halothece sp. (strain PCC 7418) TaxID=65093 RepID=UPI0002A0871F|nr:M15 family metallopeptidase [Halothece sp. PCC 7418]AFZ45109.1 D-Ala-D-Ala dipeptidase [Halothece sp. PCC 7418]